MVKVALPLKQDRETEAAGCFGGSAGDVPG